MPGRGTGPHAASHEPGGSDDLYLYLGDLSGTRLETLPRYAVQGALSPAVGTILMACTTALSTLTVSNLLICTGSTARVGTPTLVKLGLYTLDGSGNATLVASTASDTTIGSGTNTLYTKAIALNGSGGSISSYQLVRGQRYGLAYIEVGSTSSATMRCANLGVGGLGSLAPAVARVTGTGQTDLAASITNASLSGSATLLWMGAA
jgi:hypothetical protein